MRWFSWLRRFWIRPDPVPAVPLLAAINAARRRHNLRPLQQHQCLSRQAESHASYLRSRFTLNHVGLRQRLLACGFGTGAENVAANQADATAVVEGWLKSTRGHREHLLGDWRVAGVGIDGWYWVAIFA